MPGVPSGRGCDGCRKQKKKCDQLKPSCSRCLRMKISCIGNGQRRYKFHNQTAIVLSSSPHTVALAKVVECNYFTAVAPSRSPSNAMTKMASALVSALQVTDLRYDLACYGTFLKHVPCRLGANEALDASVGFLTSARPVLFKRPYSPDVLAQYGRALKELRFCLSDPVKAQTAETLCAVYLVMICQWIGTNDDHYINHPEMIAHLIGSASSRRQHWQGSFEAEILVTLALVAIFESILNPNLKFNLWYLYQPQPYGPVAQSQSIKLSNLERYGPMIRDPHLHLDEITAIYPQVRTDLDRMHRRVAKFEVENETNPDPLRHDQYQIALGALLSLACVFNQALRIASPTDMLLVQEARVFTDEVVLLTQKAARYRPLAAGHVNICLVAAMATTDEGSLKYAQMKAILHDYESDLRDANWMRYVEWIRARFERLRLHVAAFDHQDENLDMVLIHSKTSFEECRHLYGNGMCTIV